MLCSVTISTDMSMWIKKVFKSDLHTHLQNHLLTEALHLAEIIVVLVVI